ncbi:MAG TPA: malate dehydrogenase [Candidatus Thermoplasmatota archaeon]|nr:malate dehydrogenase [Candidatus Thermoplasmatota archaeon]
MAKIGIVGAGKVGANSAFALLQQMDPDEIAILEIPQAENLAVGEAADLNTAAAGLGKRTRVTGGADPSILAGSDVVVVAAGFPRKPGMTRQDLLAKNIDICRDVVGKIRANAPEAMIFYVANPVDVLTYAAWKISGKPRNHVFGMGSFHDTTRLWDLLRDQYGVPQPIEAYILGEHGETMFPARSLARVGKAAVDWANVAEAVRGKAAKIIEQKGATYYAPAISVALQVKSVLRNEKRLFPTSCVLDGEYGLRGVAVGVPAVLGRNGVEKVVELPLSKPDEELLRRSAAAIAEKVREAGL